MLSRQVAGHDLRQGSCHRQGSPTSRPSGHLSSEFGFFISSATLPSLLLEISVLHRPVEIAPLCCHSALGCLTCHINKSDAAMNRALSRATKNAGPEKLIWLAVIQEYRFGSNAAACAFAFKASSTLT